MVLMNKNIVLEIRGDIAAYKTVGLVWHVKKQGLKVRVIMTNAAKKFITPLSLYIILFYLVLDNFLILQLIRLCLI